ncbi:DNA-binding transcriptional LysR family regulator [Bradyrhizobium sp. GM0.4]
MLGTPDLYAAFMLPQILSVFRKSFPRVQVELNCALSTPLVGLVKRGDVDIALVTRMNDFTGGQVVRREQLVWMTGEQSSAHQERPIPLALLPPGNIYRDYAIDTLERANLRWRIACVSESVGGLQAAAFAGMAVTVLGRSALVPAMREIGPNEGLAAAAEDRAAALQVERRDLEGGDRLARLSRALSAPRRGAQRPRRADRAGIKPSGRSRSGRPKLRPGSTIADKERPACCGDILFDWPSERGGCFLHWHCAARLLEPLGRGP